ncbi:hypothetical protein VNO77_42750 [Canavalia gladiata]|uniref:Uncharacterized protein n=1 Tax=Canavalia gladiata TaxID=3824 RepID=A0AAN9JVA5_CANGL
MYCYLKKFEECIIILVKFTRIGDDNWSLSLCVNKRKSEEENDSNKAIHVSHSACDDFHFSLLPIDLRRTLISHYS